MQRIAASSARRFRRLAASLMASLLSAQGAFAASTDISSVPLFTSSPTAVKPNLLFILDDSGSMDSDYLPDEAGDHYPTRRDSTERYGVLARQCNGLGYNPAMTYALPVDSTGASYPNASISNAWVDGFKTSSGTVDLSSNYYFTYSGTQTALSYYVNGAYDTSTTFWKECHSAVGSNPGAAVFTKVLVSSLTAAQKQNYANWYSYYRKRILMMKSSAGIAFKSLDDQFRVGFTQISDTSVTSSSFVNVQDFGASQRSSFYSALYAASPGSFTPLRGALSKAGRYYAKKASGQTVDPIQYSCQKNFTLLSTDGYWNADTETSTYGPFQLDNSTMVGQQDGAAARPMFDGAVATRTETWKWSEYDSTVTTTVQPQKTTQVSTSTTTTNVTTPQTRLARTFRKTDSTSISDINRCPSGTSGSCTVQIVLNATVSYRVGDTVTISGTGTVNGSFVIANVVNANTYEIVLPTRPTRPTLNNPLSSVSIASCPVGQGKVWEQPQSGSLVQSTPATTTTTTTTLSQLTTLSTVKTATNYTKVITTINGVAQTPVTTTTTTNVPVANTVTTSSSPPTVATTGPVNGTTTSSGPNWTDSGAGSYVSGACVSSATPSNSTPVSGSATSTTTAPVVVNNPATTANNGAANASSVGPTHDDGNKANPTYTVQDSTSGGSSNSLADVAMYYYQTDLRSSDLGNCQGALGSGTDVCTNNVDPKNGDDARWQHMTTYTLGLGVNGTLKYDKAYGSPAATSGDFYDIVQGTKNWPIPGDGKGGENIDDLWHAAVDGRGRYFSAGDPTELAASLSDSLIQIKQQVGSGSAAATTTLRPVAGNNALFVGKYFTETWHGDLDKYLVDPATGALTKSNGSVTAVLNARVAAGTARNIYYFKPGTGNTGTLRPFTYSNLSADSLNGNLDNACSKSPALTQCASLVPADVTTANSGSNLLNWFIGGSNSVYRDRANKLGDLGNASPVFVGQPAFKYTEHSYQTFASTNASRTQVVYVAANDGMLHAFDADTLQEKWAYVPTAMLPKLYRLADKDYARYHQYYVDATPVVGDIWVGGAWKTILVGGFGAGGRGYYALDITDPANPAALWEFKDTDMGLSYGNPIITKRADGTWVVVFSSGYNNNTGGGDGNGHLYVVNANTGAQIMKIDTMSGATPVGTTTTPSGLGKINDWVESDVENVAKRFYGGDLLGNLWRFDIDSVTQPYQSAMRLAQLKVGTTIQPITTQPAMAEVTYSGTKYAVVYVTTGRYLGTSDLSNTDRQTIYALKDALATTGLGDVHASGSIVDVSVAETDNVRKAARTAVNWSTKIGWKLDLPSAGERVNVDSQLKLNVLSVASNIPSTDACTAGGESWIYELDIATGGALQGATGDISGGYEVGHWLGNATTVGLTSIQLQDGSLMTIGTNANGELFTRKPPPPTSTTGATRRTSWRELAN